MDIDYIKESYAKMPDEELIGLVKHEAASLTPEARAALQAELAKRNYGASFEEALITDQQNKLLRDEAKERKKAEDEFLDTVLPYVFNAKYNKVNNEAVKKGLMEQGITEEQAGFTLEKMEEQAQTHLRATERNMMIGLLLCVGGTAITYFTYQAASGGGVYVVTWGAILFGLLRFFQNLGLHYKFKKILDHIRNKQPFTGENK